MEQTTRPRVKICCIGSIAEAWLAIRHGASALGLVSEMPSGPGVIPEDVIAQIAATLPPSVSSFLLTSKQDAASIIAQQRRCRVNTIQICDRLPTDSYIFLAGGLNPDNVAQAIRQVGSFAIDVCNGVRTDGALDEVKLSKFFRRIYAK